MDDPVGKTLWLYFFYDRTTWEVFFSSLSPKRVVALLL
jgi:hypothetical protein